MRAISAHHLNQAVLDATRNRPFLGICMGLQVLMEFSEENGGTDLLGLYPGKVRHFPESRDEDGRRRKIPHMGWNQVKQSREHPLWQGIPDRSRFYFVHSYYVDPTDSELVAGSTDYGLPFASAVARENLFATQFHPEKSADMGLQLLQNFVNWDI
jgi:glutamine amidotransferase